MNKEKLLDFKQSIMIPTQLDLKTRKSKQQLSMYYKCLNVFGKSKRNSRLRTKDLSSRTSTWANNCRFYHVRKISVGVLHKMFITLWQIISLGYVHLLGIDKFSWETENFDTVLHVCYIFISEHLKLIPSLLEVSWRGLYRLKDHLRLREQFTEK